MSYLVEIPVRGGGRMVVEAEREDFDEDELVLASGASGAVDRAAQTLEDSLDVLGPPMQTLLERLRQMAPDHCCVQFGLKMGGETGIIVAKGTAEVNFTVTLTWSRDGRPAPS